MRIVALYARVSTKGGRQDTENQLIALRDYCARQNWKIAGEYVDHETGGTSQRKHFHQMFADARARKFDLLLFWSLDRLIQSACASRLTTTRRCRSNRLHQSGRSFMIPFILPRHNGESRCGTVPWNTLP